MSGYFVPKGYANMLQPNLQIYPLFTKPKRIDFGCSRHPKSKVLKLGESRTRLPAAHLLEELPIRVRSGQ
jgi:hypothetical protein